MKYRPLHDRVLVRRVESEKVSTGGIVLPEDAQEKPDQGIVVAVGPGNKNSEGIRLPMTLVVDDKVMFGKFSGQTVKLDGEELVVLREEDIFAVIED